MAKLADLLVNYCNNVQPGDWALVNGDVSTLPLMREIARAVLEAGGYIDTKIGDQALSKLVFDFGNDDQLQWVSPLTKLAFEEVDVLFNLFGTRNTKHMSTVDPAKTARSQKAMKGVIETYFDRVNKGELRWVISRFPTEANAQEAEMSLEEYEDFVFRACLLEEDDPIAAWMAIREEQERVVQWLAGKEQVVVTGPRVELTMSIKDRTFINSDGKDNMPSGEVFTSPVEDSMNGWIAFSYPTILSSREVSGVRLQFDEGRIVDASAEKGEEFMLSQIDQDDGARRVGEFAIGTNYAIDRFTGDTLFDEKIGGTMHMALGRGFKKAGGKNESIIHWDMVHDMRDGSRIEVDGELLYENGEFKI
ncbi:MAG: aminopeptidase [Anaerolineales bacterium]